MLLELQNVKKSYASPETGLEIPVLKGVDLTVTQGERIAITGPSGAGKSTLLHILGALDSPTEGTVLFDGVQFIGLNEFERTRIRNREIGYVFQLHHLLPQCTVLENVLIPTLPIRDRSILAQSRMRGRDLLEKAGLSDRLDHRPSQLSGGECLRVAVVRAFINQPRLVLADEPTGSLDEETSVQITQVLLDINRLENTALVVVTHSPDVASFMECTYRLHNGVLST